MAVATAAAATARLQIRQVFLALLRLAPNSKVQKAHHRHCEMVKWNGNM
jgi:hypothetical protein